MGILIRSAQVEHDPVVLPLYTAQRTVEPSPLASAPFVAPRPGLTVSRTAPTDETNRVVPPENGFPMASSATVLEEISPPELDPKLKQTLLAEMDLAHKAAVKEGFESGHAQGLAESSQLLQTKIDALTKLLNSATEVLQSQIAGLEDIVVALGFETACKIMGSALQDRNSVIAVVRQVISHVKESEPITIRVAPADYEHLVENQSEITQTHFSSGITLQPDDRVVLGGCLIETSGGSLDGRLETQLQQVKDALLSAQRQRPDRKEALHAL